MKKSFKRSLLPLFLHKKEGINTEFDTLLCIETIA